MDFAPKSRKAHSRNSKKTIKTNREQFIKRVSRFSPFDCTNNNLENCYYCGCTPSKLKDWDYCDHTYSGKRSYNWKESYKVIIQSARMIAITQLGKALSNNLISNKSVIKTAIEDVKDKLENKIFKIYPLIGCATDARAMAGKDEISIRTTLIWSIVGGEEKSFRLAKTLIHETFHIIGGCDNNNADELIEDSTDQATAFLKISDCETIENMCADAFAQFVMMC